MGEISVAPAGTLCRRAEGPGDERLLLHLYATTRLELCALGWNDEQLAAFVQQQFTAQRRHYALQFPGAAREIVELDGRPVGRILVWHGEDEVHIVDVALLPEHRGQGIGQFLLTDVITEAAEAGLAVRLQVLATNPALRLYLRNGFRVVDDASLYWTLERPPR